MTSTIENKNRFSINLATGSSKSIRIIAHGTNVARQQFIVTWSNGFAAAAIVSGDANILNLNQNQAISVSGGSGDVTISGNSLQWCHCSVFSSQPFEASVVTS